MTTDLLELKIHILIVLNNPANNRADASARNTL